MQTGVDFFPETPQPIANLSVSQETVCVNQNFWFTKLNHRQNLKVLDRISKDSALLPALRLAAAEICAVRGPRKKSLVEVQ